MRDELDHLAMGFIVSFHVNPNAGDSEKDKMIKAAYAWAERFDAHVRKREKKRRESDDAKRREMDSHRTPER